MLPPHPEPSLYLAVLEAGDALAAALRDGDLDAAARAIDARRAVMDRLVDARLPPPPPELTERFREQDAEINRRLHSQLMSLREAVAMTTYAASAHSRYQTAPAPVLDTAPRRR